MGFFSWVTSDTEMSITNRYTERGALPVYVLCPDGTNIYEDNYNGYGVFGGKDIYELVAEWNRENLTPDYLRKPERSRWSDDEQGQIWYESAVRRYELSCNRLTDYKEGMTDEQMFEKYGEDWKRTLGIDIACYDDQNAALRYPIKFVENPNVDYESVKPSNGCPNQGFFM